MLSRGKVTPSTVSYYTDTVAAGVEDYYAGRGEAAGEWVGNGSAAAGLEGEVSGDQLRRLFDGIHPVTGELLRSAYRVRAGADRVTGWDLTFSAPKSVSTLWAVAGGEVGMEVRKAHDAAVRAALVYLEEHAAFSRQGRGGVRQVDTEGLVAASFVHRTSRAGDPQLHTHVLVSGRVRCLDGEWRALDSRALHRQLKPAGMLYQAALRSELTDRLGVAWGDVDRHGQAEIDGVPEGLRRHYSSRRREVEARARERIATRELALGRSLTPEERRRAFEKAVLESRPAKVDGELTDAGLHDRWRSQAGEIGFPAERWVPGTLGRERSRVPSSVVIEVVGELTVTKSTFLRSDVVQQVTRRAPTTLRHAEKVRRWVESTVDEILGHGGIVRFAVPLEVPESLRRRDGLSVFQPHGLFRYTTVETLAVEHHVLDTTLAGRDAHRAIAQATPTLDAIERARLGPDQALAVERLVSAGEAVACLVGPAGTGKSRTVGAAADAWVTSGIPVRGLALSATAAGVLRGEAGIATETIAKFLHEHDRLDGPDPVWQLRTGEVLVVDEAGMVGTHDLARLLAHTEAASGKLVLVGDHAQLDAIDAGGLFRLLASDTNAAELSEVHRFTSPWEAAASLALRDCQPDALTPYLDHDRIHGGDRLAMLDTAFDHWHHLRGSGESIVIVTLDQTTADALADRVRAERVAAGEVEAGGIQLDRHTVGVGDEIVTLRNDRRLLVGRDGWVRNGDRWHIDHCHPDGSITASDLTRRGQLRLPADYVAEHVTLGYALTIHKAQGITVDHAIAILDDTATSEALYVAMTRGRHSNTAHVITDHLDPDTHRPTPAGDAEETLLRALRRPTAERTAIEHERIHQRPEPRSLIDEWANLNPRRTDPPAPEIGT